MAHTLPRRLRRRLRLGFVGLVALGSAPSAAWAQTELAVPNVNNSVTVHARTSGGNVAPLRTLSGAATGLNLPQAVAVDRAADQLVVVNLGSVSLTFYPLTASGNTAPARTITGPATGLNIPRGLALDAVHGEIVVVNTGGPSVTVYARAAFGNAAPLRTLAGPATGLLSPYGVLVDAAHDELIVADVGNSSIKVYPRTANGDVAPLRTLSGAATMLNLPTGVALDPVTDTLLVANFGSAAITAYPRTATGDTSPVRNLAGASTGLSGVYSVAVDPVSNELMVGNQGGSSVTAYPREATGNVGPKRILSGATTGLSSPGFLAAFSPAASPLVSTGTGPGGGPHVKLFRFDTVAAAPTQLGGGFFAYDGGFTGGVQATLVHVQGSPFVVTGVGSGGGPHIKLFRVTDLAAGAVAQVGPGFMAYNPGFTGGARVAATTDVDGNLLIITGVGSGGGAHVKVFQVTNLVTGDVIQLGDGFFAYDQAFTGGVNVGAQ